MPAKKIINDTMILSCAIKMLKEKGINSINARSLAKELKCSTQPIYNSFNGMDDLKNKLLEASLQIYENKIEDAIKENKNFTYKAMGLTYIKFAIEEKELFKFLFMRDRSKEINLNDEDFSFKESIKLIMKNNNFSYNNAYFVHVSLWIYVHGIASQFATNYINWDINVIDKMLTHQYLAIIEHVKKEGEIKYE